MPALRHNLPSRHPIIDLARMEHLAASGRATHPRPSTQEPIRRASRTREKHLSSQAIAWNVAARGGRWHEPACYGRPSRIHKPQASLATSLWSARTIQLRIHIEQIKNFVKPAARLARV